SSTTVSGLQYLLDYGTTYDFRTATHHLTLYRHSSGALVFSAGTVQWSWGLDNNHDNAYASADIAIQQATVNLLADMGSQPANLQSGLVAASASTDHAVPSTAIGLPNNTVVPVGHPLVISGTASDSGGTVGGVEVSVDNGATWHSATGRNNWSYT